MKKIEFNKDKFDKFKEEYQKAIEEGADSFFFDSNQFLTSYAKYLIEYLSPNYE
jgi:hypothetical protein